MTKAEPNVFLVINDKYITISQPSNILKSEVQIYYIQFLRQYDSKNTILIGILNTIRIDRREDQKNSKTDI
uniref:Uncharacterized protein n=1 Tax=Romanomermis culicivorax TaxID=13658 RepID=A0A915IMT3_ROMCU